MCVLNSQPVVVGDRRDEPVQICRRDHCNSTVLSRVDVGGVYWALWSRIV